MQIILFYIPTATNDEAQWLAKKAIEHRKAACANIFPIQSVFPWEGSIHNEHEYVLILKTMPYLKQSLMDLISELHSYEIPCILNWEAEVKDAYGHWMMKNVIEDKLIT